MKSKIDSLHAIDHNNQLKIYNLLFEQRQMVRVGCFRQSVARLIFVHLLNTGDRFEMEEV